MPEIIQIKTSMGTYDYVLIDGRLYILPTGQVEDKPAEPVPPTSSAIVTNPADAWEKCDQAPNDEVAMEYNRIRRVSVYCNKVTMCHFHWETRNRLEPYEQGRLADDGHALNAFKVNANQVALIESGDYVLLPEEQKAIANNWPTRRIYYSGLEVVK